MKLVDCMITDVVQAEPEGSIGTAARRMDERGVGSLVVTRAGAVKGIVTDGDLLACLAQTHDPYRPAVSALAPLPSSSEPMNNRRETLDTGGPG